MRVFSDVLVETVQQTLVTVLSDGPKREYAINKAFVHIFQVDSFDFGYQWAKLHKICLRDSDFTCKIIKVALRINNLDPLVIKGMKLKWELKFKEEIEPGRGDVIFLIPTYGYFPIWLDIPNQILIRNGYFLHLSLLKRYNLEKGKIFGTDSLNVDPKFL